MNNPFLNNQTSKNNNNFRIFNILAFTVCLLFLFSCVSDPGAFTKPTKINGISFLSQRDMPDSVTRVPETKRPRVIENPEQETSESQNSMVGRHPNNQFDLERHMMILLLINVFQAFIIAFLCYRISNRKN